MAINFIENVKQWKKKTTVIEVHDYDININDNTKNTNSVLQNEDYDINHESYLIENNEQL
jgi:hypothetical protein